MPKFKTTPEAYNLLHEGAIALSSMEAAGIRVDQPYLNATIDGTKKAIQGAEYKITQDKDYKVWRKRFGSKTKIGSYEQLGVIIFEEMGHKPTKYTPTGRPATDEEAFEDIEVPLVKLFKKAKKLEKVLSTYLLGIQRELDKYGYVHPSYNLNTVSTYRSSCNMPNFQNIPIRDPEQAALIRKCYIPSQGNRLIENDFGQLEFRIAAVHSKDPELIRYNTDPNADIHKDMAKQIFMLNGDQVSRKGTRDCAKNMYVFPTLFGQAYFDIAEAVWKSMHRRKFVMEGTDKLVAEYLAEKGITKLGNVPEKGQLPRRGTFMEHIYQLEKRFWEKFKVHAAWKKSSYEKYVRNNGLMMYTGFAVNGYHKRNDIINYPIQGSSFHCLLWSLIEFTKRLKKYKMKSRLCGEIHDCILGDVVPKETNTYLDMAHEIMAVELPKKWKWITVPLVTESEVTEIDASWYTKKVWIKNNNSWMPKQ